ncbi:MAG: bifunctional (p)ppGpp synthetase/guanosine-3',5'-bis(diphosphate) 3'-pyrophosphohydrolase [Rhodospirillaceae bacterium]|nr:bifunctional (p)ppGpp synthetase/guanosine-3',5'-bis(diphosphate) 3'-pyrophosphohydrolase [Rhodospirillaceae bacterium]
MLRQHELIKRVKSYDPGADVNALNRAYIFSMEAHGAQKRASGDPYFSHPVEVAGILSDKKLDCDSIITGLLHDTVEDTVATMEDIQGLFGEDVARLVDGVTKLSQIETLSDRAKQAENFRKLLLAMSEDIRVLLVKQADRLHNMRTLEFIRSEDKRALIARETMDIYAPLAERIGILDWKEELEDRAFAELNADARMSIVKRLQYLREKGGDLIGRVTLELTQTLADCGVKAEVTGREKSPYSIWRKMRRKNIGFEQLSDIMAFRVVVSQIQDCYQALGAIHGHYRVIPGRFKDYVSIPKPNDYRSLHTSVYGPENQRIEIQIRTHEMHQVAELGVAAHWQFKQNVMTDGRQFRWLRELLEILEHAEAPEEFLEHTKLEMFSDQVFCFSPKGDLMELPQGASPVDFAYAVHTEIGDTCVGAKINGQEAPLRTELKNGDQIEILTGLDQSPSPSWESFVVTGKARACIRRFVRSQTREQYNRLGQEIIEKAFRREGRKVTKKTMTSVLLKLSCRTVDDLLVAVGQGRYTGQDVFAAAYPRTGRNRQRAAPISGDGKGISEYAVPIRGLIPGMAVHLAVCCHPLPGDQIVGIVATGKGITVHTSDCETLSNFIEMPEQWVDVQWEVGAEDASIHVSRINVILANRPGCLAAMTAVIGRYKGNISNLKITDRSKDFFEMQIDIEVSDVQHLTNIIAGLRADSAVGSVERTQR